MIKLINDVVKDGKVIIKKGTVFDSFGRYLDKYFVCVNGDRVFFNGDEILIDHKGTDDSYFIKEVPMRMLKNINSKELIDMDDLKDW